MKGDMGDTGATGPQGPPGPRSGGVTYVRWGRTTCPDIEGTGLVYTGRAAGSYYGHSGGGNNYQCITEEPENFDFGAGTVDTSYMYGAEYEIWGNNPSSNLPLNEHDVPCSVCYVATRLAVLMIPGKYTCPPNWTLEYYGYLMAERHNHHQSTFECVDVASETVTGGHTNQNGALFYISCGASLWQSAMSSLRPAKRDDMCCVHSLTIRSVSSRKKSLQQLAFVTVEI